MRAVLVRRILFHHIQRIPIHFAVVDVVVRGEIQIHQQRGAGLQAFRLEVDAHVADGALPYALVGIIVGGISLAARLGVLVHDCAVLILHGEAGSRTVADERILHLGDGAVASHGVALGIVGGIAVHVGIRQIRIAAEGIGGLIARILHQIGVRIERAVLQSSVQIGRTILLFVFVFQRGADIIHGRLAPAAPVTQDGDGVLNACGAVRALAFLDEQEAFHIVAVVVQFLRDGEADLGGNGDGFLGLDDRAGLVGHGQADVRVTGAQAVGITVEALGNVLVDDRLILDDLVKQRLRILMIEHAVVVEVVLDVLVRLVRLAVDEPLDLTILDRRGPGIKEFHAAVGKHVLREELAVERDAHGLVRQVVHREGDLILARAVRIVAQLGLDLAVRHAGCSGGNLRLLTGGQNFLHLDIGAGVHRRLHVGKACALLEYGIVVAAVFLHQRFRGGHQQALDQAAGIEILGLNALFSEVLREHRHKAGNLRRSHGGAGHALIVLAADHRTVGRPDVPARRGDLGLEAQIAGNAPAGEVAHGLVFALACAFAQLGLRLDGDLTGVIGHAVGLARRCAGLDLLTVRLRDGNRGSGVFIAGQVHAERARLVVDNDRCDRAVGNRSVGLFKEGAAAARADGDLALEQIGNRRKAGFLFARLIGDENELMRTDKGLDRRVAVIARALGEENALAVELHRHADDTVVIHGGNGKGVGIGTGGTAGVQVRTFAIQIAVGRHIRPGAVVAGGDGDDRILFAQVVKDRRIGLIGIRGEARNGRTERQVDGVSAEHNGVLDGDHVVGIVSAAALAEHLHDDQLRVGRRALRQNGLERLVIAAAVFDIAVARRNTGNVRAVLALLVVIMGNVQIAVNIVDGKRNLGVEINTVRAGNEAGCVQPAPGGGDFGLFQQVDVLAGLLDGVLERVRIEQLVVGVKAGIDDRDLAARTGVVGRPCAGRTDHVGRHDLSGLVRGNGSAGLVTHLDHNVFHAGNFLDLLDLGGRNVGGNDVGCQGHVPDHVQLTAAQHLAGDTLFHALLLCLERIAVLHGAAVLANGLYRILVQRGSVGQDDRNADVALRQELRRIDLNVHAALFARHGDGRAVIYLAPFDAVVCALLGIIRRVARYGQRKNHDHTQHHRKQTFPCVLHVLSPLFGFFLCSPRPSA